MSRRPRTGDAPAHARSRAPSACARACSLRSLSLKLLFLLGTLARQAPPPCFRRAELELGKGQMGSTLMGSLHVFMFFDRYFLALPLTLLSGTCQGEPFSPICQNSLLSRRPHQCRPHFISVAEEPNCPFYFRHQGAIFISVAKEPTCRWRG